MHSSNHRNPQPPPTHSSTRPPASPPSPPHSSSPTKTATSPPPRKLVSAWFVAPKPASTPTSPPPPQDAPAGIVDALALAEIARSIPFLVDALPPQTSPPSAPGSQTSSTGSTRLARVIAREPLKDHTASVWLLIATAFARLLADEANLTAYRTRFKNPTFRNQVSVNGLFPHEITTDVPFRNTLLNFDLLAGTCELLSTPFSSLWPFELEEVPASAQSSPSSILWSKIPLVGPTSPTQGTSAKSPAAAPASCSPAAPSIAQSTSTSGAHSQRPTQSPTPRQLPHPPAHPLDHPIPPHHLATQNSLLNTDSQCSTRPPSDHPIPAPETPSRSSSRPSHSR